MARAGGTLPPPSHVTMTISAMVGSFAVRVVAARVVVVQWSFAGSAGRGSEDGTQEREHPGPGACRREAAIAAQQLPGVDVGGDDEQVDDRLSARSGRQQRAEGLLAPTSVQGPAVTG